MLNLCMKNCYKQIKASLYVCMHVRLCVCVGPWGVCRLQYHFRCKSQEHSLLLWVSVSSWLGETLLSSTPQESSFLHLPSTGITGKGSAWPPEPFLKQVFITVFLNHFLYKLTVISEVKARLTLGFNIGFSGFHLMHEQEIFLLHFMACDSWGLWLLN